MFGLKRLKCIKKSLLKKTNKTLTDPLGSSKGITVMTNSINNLGGGGWGEKW